MDIFSDLLGFAAAGLTTFAFLPQVVKTWNSGSTADLSLPMLLALSTGVAMWLVYGLASGQAPVIVANGITLVLVSFLLGLKLRDVLRSRI